MIIDFHVHIGEHQMYSQSLLEYWRSMNPEDFNEQITPDFLYRKLSNAGIDYAVILAEACEGVTGVVPNEYVAKFCSSRREFIPFAAINPNRERNPVKKLEEAIEKLGMKGLKLSPPYMYFYPNEKKIYPIYKRAQELEIPIIFHTGSSIFKGSRLKFAHPIYLDDIAVDFPELRIIQAHGGRGIWYETAYFLAKLHSNVYLDITGLPPKNLLKYYPELEKIQDKVIYGSDYPAIGDLKQNIEKIKSLPISKKAIEKILGENARKILKLKL